VTTLLDELKVRQGVREVLNSYGGRYPDLRTCVNERLIPRGAWAVLLNARVFDVRFVTFRSPHGYTRHLSPYSMIHFRTNIDGDEVVDDSFTTLCGQPFRRGATHFEDYVHRHAEDCPACRARAVRERLIVMEEIDFEEARR